MSYEVRRLKNGREYRYFQSTYRDESGKVRTVYEGMIDAGGNFIPKRKRHGGLGALVDILLEIAETRQVGESEAEIAARVERQSAEYELRDHVNALLKAPTITLESMAEIAAMQAEDAAKATVEQPHGKEMFWTDPFVPTERSEAPGPMPDAPEAGTASPSEPSPGEPSQPSGQSPSDAPGSASSDGQAPQA